MRGAAGCEARTLNGGYTCVGVQRAGGSRRDFLGADLPIQAPKKINHFGITIEVSFRVVNVGQLVGHEPERGGWRRPAGSLGINGRWHASPGFKRLVFDFCLAVEDFPVNFIARTAA